MVPRIEGLVQVEDDEAVAAVMLAAVGLDVVVGPVVVAEEQLGGHVVGELVDVEQLLHLVVSLLHPPPTGGGYFFAQLDDVVEHLVGAVGERCVLEHVDFVVVVAEVGIHELVVIGFAQVQHPLEGAVDVFSHLHQTLQVEVDARTLDNGGQRGVHEARVGVVAAVAHQQGLVADMRFLGEEGVVEMVLVIEHLVRLQLH